MTGLTLANLRTASPDVPAGDLIRLHIDLDSAAVERRRLHPGPVEFPAIHYRRYNGRPHRHVWLGEVGDGPLPARLARVGVGGGGVSRYDPGPAAFPGEPVFVPRPHPDREADGVVLSVVLDAGADRSVLVVLDAATMAELARAPLPHRLPYGFHGQFYDARDPARSMN